MQSFVVSEVGVKVTDCWCCRAVMVVSRCSGEGARKVKLQSRRKIMPRQPHQARALASKSGLHPRDGRQGGSWGECAMSSLPIPWLERVARRHAAWLGAGRLTALALVQVMSRRTAEFHCLPRACARRAVLGLAARLRGSGKAAGREGGSFVEVVSTPGSQIGRPDKSILRLIRERTRVFLRIRQR